MYRCLPLLAFAWSTTALAGDRRPATITLQVQTPSGAPIPHARFRFPVEGDAVRTVNELTGVAPTADVYLEDGTEVPIEKGQVYAVEVTASGYAPQSRTVMVDRRRTTVVVTMLPEGEDVALPGR
jgi:hypothetical protein